MIAYRSLTAAAQRTIAQSATKVDKSNKDILRVGAIVRLATSASNLGVKFST
jgi:hypothetical protein